MSTNAHPTQNGYDAEEFVGVDAVETLTPADLAEMAAAEDNPKMAAIARRAGVIHGPDRTIEQITEGETYLYVSRDGEWVVERWVPHWVPVERVPRAINPDPEKAVRVPAEKVEVYAALVERHDELDDVAENVEGEV